jgi:hypothetical protein
MTKPGWGAVVQGEPTDLGDWVDALKEPFDPWVEIHGGETVLRSVTLDELTSANNVRSRALAHIERLNGAFAVWQQCKPVRFGGVVQFASDGKQQRTIFAEMAAIEARGRANAFAIAIGPDGKPYPKPPPQPSEVQRWASIAEADDLLDDAIIFFGKGPGWFDIYKAIECLYARAGGEHAFLALNWEKETKRLKTTANWFRHARRRNDRLENPMELKEGHALLGRLLSRALREAKP